MQTKVSNKADVKLKADCDRALLNNAENILSEIASETVKTINGIRNARTTFLAIEGPSNLPNCS
jgi:hypothetical protein